MKKIFLVLVAIISVLCSYNNTYAESATNSLGYGFSHVAPNISWRITETGDFTGFHSGYQYLTGEIANWLSTTHTDLGVLDINNDGAQDSSLTAYPRGRQVVYILARNCMFLNAAFSIDWRLESVSSSEVNYKSDSTNYDMTEPLNLYQLVYRNDTDQDTVASVIPAAFECSGIQWLPGGGGSYPKQSFLDVLSLYISADLPIDYSAKLEEIKNAIEKSGDAAQVLEQQREEDKQDMENAQQDASADGSDSQQEASQTGQTILQAFISFVGALASASPSNCNIDMNTGFVDFGAVNLCALSPPPAFQVISSIVVIGFAVPLSLAAGKKIIELFRSFQT